jgi:hypothetical protein
MTPMSPLEVPIIFLCSCLLSMLISSKSGKYGLPQLAPLVIKSTQLSTFWGYGVALTAFSLEKSLHLLLLEYIIYSTQKGQKFESGIFGLITQIYENNGPLI